MKISEVELRRLKLPLVSPFRTSFGSQTERDVLIVKVVTPEAEGWAECSALEDPVYSPEYVQGAAEMIERYLLPALRDSGDVRAETVGPTLNFVKGNRMAKAALETAVLDAELKARGQSLGSHLGAVKERVPAGVSVGIMNSIPELLEAVEKYVGQGYLRIKLKIEPGWDVEPVKAVREKFGDDLLLQVDANTAYHLADAPHLARLDEFNLLLIEQPLDEEDLVQHAELSKRIKTPVCLDESIVSAKAAADALKIGAASVINVKPARVGGYLESRRIHDLCHAAGVPVWCGGMLETGIGRAANVALAALPGFTLPGDTSASDRYYKTDITEPFVLEDGHLALPTGPGIGVTPIPEVLDSLTTSAKTL
jgi:o-succinylbenzoate synthase